MGDNLIFPYRYIDVPSLGRIFYPLITITLKTIDKGFVDFEFIVDTGADLTTIPYYMADRVGINLKDAVKSQSQGIGGFIINTWIARLTLYIKGQAFPVRASVTEDNKTPFLLGRVDLLDTLLTWNFDSSSKTIHFQKV